MPDDWQANALVSIIKKKARGEIVMHTWESNSQSMQ